MLKQFKLIIFFAGFFSSAIFAQLDSLAGKAVEVSPKLKMLQAKFDAAKSKAVQVSNLPDPTLTLGLMNLPINSFSFTQEPMTGKLIGLSQQFPFPGKLSASGEISNKDAEIIQQEILDAKNEIIKNIKQKYYELSFVNKSIAITEQTKLLYKNIYEVAKARYEVSEGSQQNILKVDLELTSLNDKLSELKSKQASLIAEITSSLLQPSDSKIQVSELEDLNFINLSIQQLDSIAIENRPFLAGVIIAKQKATLQKSLAEYQYYPDFNITVQYAQRDRIAKTNTPLDDFLSFMIGITLPLNYGGKNSAKVEESIEMENFYAEQYNLALQSLNTSFGTSLAKLKSIEERIKLIKEVWLPQVSQTFSSTLSGYQVGSVDFINVVDVQNKQYDLQINLYKLKKDYLSEISELEFLTGAKLK
ncbi:MAG: TolC family protein [Ignavibacteriaceae bacterium]